MREGHSGPTEASGTRRDSGLLDRWPESPGGETVMLRIRGSGGGDGLWFLMDTQSRDAMYKSDLGDASLQDSRSSSISLIQRVIFQTSPKSPNKQKPPTSKKHPSSPEGLAPNKTSVDAETLALVYATSRRNRQTQSLFPWPG
jgi:hypothetical protein